MGGNKRVPLLPKGYVGKGYVVRPEVEQDLLQFGVRRVSKEEQHVLAKQVRKPPPPQQVNSPRVNAYLIP